MLILAGHSPANDCGLDTVLRVETLPSAIAPLAQKRNDVGADVILAKEFQRLVLWWHSLMNIGADAILPCCHICLLRTPRLQQPLSDHGSLTASLHPARIDSGVTSECRNL